MWYEIGVLYERHHAYDYAEDAFLTALDIDPRFDKNSEVWLRLGLINKYKKNLQRSLEVRGHGQL